MKKVYIGIDAHKASNTLALAFAGNGEARIYGKAPTDLDSFLRVVRRISKRYALTKEDMLFCYEAGPTGFVLARRLLGLGYTCLVVAPSLIPTRSGDRVKTDRRDARRLASLLRAGELSGIHIPDPEDEIIRDVCRCRTDAVGAQSRAKQQLGALLLRNGYHYTGKAQWTEAHMRYLRELVLPSHAQKLMLEEYLRRVDEAVAQVQRIDHQLTALLPTWSRRNFALALQGFRGFQQTASMIIASELGDLRRFDNPRPLMGFLGLVPSEASSGQRRRQAGITKCGNSHARWILIEVAGHYRMGPKVSKELSKRQGQLTREVRAISWKAQNRLHQKTFRLLLRQKQANVVKTAIARELSAFIWELGQLPAHKLIKAA